MENYERKNMNKNTLDPKKEYPRFGWDLLYCTKEEHECEYCGAKIMYRFFIKHPEVAHVLAVGSDCVEKLTSDEDLYRTVGRSRRILEDIVGSYTRFCETFKTTRKGNLFSKKHSLVIFEDKFSNEGVLKLFWMDTKQTGDGEYYDEDDALEAAWDEVLLKPNKIVATLPWNNQGP